MSRIPALTWPSLSLQDLIDGKGKIMSHDETVDGETGQLIDPAILKSFASSSLNITNAEQDTGTKWQMNGLDAPIYVKSFYINDLSTDFLTGFKQPSNVISPVDHNIFVVHEDLNGLYNMIEVGKAALANPSNILEWVGNAGSAALVFKTTEIESLGYSKAFLTLFYIKDFLEPS